jgi:hypothetical protein
MRPSVLGPSVLTHHTFGMSNIHSFFVSQYEHAKPAQVHVYLLEEHKHWKVPERRVVKFVKRHRRAPGSAAGHHDDDMSTMSTMSMSSVSQRAKSVAKGVGNILHLRTRSKNKGDKDHPPVFSLLGALKDDGVSEVHEDDPLDSLLFSSPIKQAQLNDSQVAVEFVTDDSQAPTEFVTALEPVEEAETEVKGRNLAFADDNDGLAFADDNDGKKEGGLCAPCEGCNIL